VKDIGKYQVVEEIARGATGVVYKCRDPLTERVVAVKTFPAELGPNGDTTPTFDPARTASLPAHDNIVTLYDVGVDGRHPYVAMEYLDGSDLRKTIDRGEPLPLEQRLRIMLGVCEGLAHAHAREVVHRHIKPRHVHVSLDGRVKILDFGPSCPPISNMSQPGAVHGDPSYLSPEQVREEEVDHRTDIFSAGATFYELLTYQKPFPGDTFDAIVSQVLNDSPPPIESVNPALPSELSHIVERAMAKDVYRRYQHIHDLARDLERFGQMLEVRKSALLAEARREIEQLDRLEALVARTTVWCTLPPPPGGMTAAMLRELLNGEGEEDQGGGAPGYLEAVEARDRARLEQERQIARLLREAEAREKRGEPARALVLSENALNVFPRHSEALALSARLQAALSERLPNPKDDREAAHRQVPETRASREAASELLKVTEALALDAKRLEKAGREVPPASMDDVDEVFGEVPYQPDDIDALISAPSDEVGFPMVEARAMEGRPGEGGEASSTPVAHAVRAEADDRSEVWREIEESEKEWRETHEKDRQVTDLLEQAEAQASRGSYETAFSLISQVLTLSPDHALALRLDREVREERAARERDARRKAERIEGALDLAREAEKSERLEKALELARIVLSEDAAHEEAQAMATRLQTLLENRRQREALEREASEVLTLAEGEAACGEYAAAVATLEKAEPRLGPFGHFAERLARYRHAVKIQEELLEEIHRAEPALDPRPSTLEADAPVAGPRERAAPSPPAPELAASSPARVQAARRRRELVNVSAGGPPIESTSGGEGPVALGDEALSAFEPSDDVVRIEELERRLVEQQEGVRARASGSSHAGSQPARYRKKRRPLASPWAYGAAAVVALLLGFAFSSWTPRTPAAAETVSSGKNQTPPGAASGSEVAQGLEAARRYLENRDFAEAVLEARAVLQRDPSHPEAQEILQQAQEKLDFIVAELSRAGELFEAARYEEAREVLAAVRELAPLQSEAQGIMTRLDELGAQRAEDARREMGRVKTRAEAVLAATRARDLFERAQTLEVEALRLHEASEHDAATRKFLEARDAYRRAETEALAKAKTGD
jgi:tetratricopeptide (TPR) repeat protein